VLHADAVMFDRRPPRALPTELAVLKGINARGSSTLRAGTDDAKPRAGFTTTQDGEITGTVGSNDNWTFARFVLGRIPTGQADAFIGLWYHAVAAYFFRNGEFGELDWHLADGAKMLPADARLLFDRGALAEVLSMNLMQEAAKTGRPTMRRGSASGELILSPSTALPPPEQGQKVAEAYYRAAIRVDPDFAEAHARLARLLDLTRRDQEGRGEIRLALDSSSDADVRFFAHLFGVRVAAALGQFSDADVHALSALRLFPQAQSTILAASAVALHRGYVRRAQDLIAELPDPAELPDGVFDPWIVYPFGPGRSADRLLAELWRTTPSVH